MDMSSVPFNELRRLVEHMATAVLLLDHDLVVRFMNPAAEMMFEVSAQRACGAPMRELLQDATECCEQLHHTLENEHPYSDREKELTLNSGRPFTVDCTVTPITEPGQPKGLLLELVRIDRAMRINREEQLLSQQLASRALLRGMAHEIKNPLGGLRGAAQLLERELDDEGLKEYTQIIIGEADRLQNLVDRMLGPNQLPQRAPVNIHEVLEHVRSLVKVECPPGVSIEPDYDPSIPSVMADRDQLVQVVLNLVRNAVQAVGEHGHILLCSRIERQFTVGGVRHKLVAAISVIDDGPGIPKELQERIFFPMVSGNAKGSGLGLSIAQSIVHQHGGLIEWKSHPGETLFKILLPLEPMDE